MPKSTNAKPKEFDQAIEAAVERLIWDFVRSELVREHHSDFASARSRHFGAAIEAYLATAKRRALWRRDLRAA